MLTQVVTSVTPHVLHIATATSQVCPCSMASQEAPHPTIHLAQPLNKQIHLWHYQFATLISKFVPHDNKTISSRHSYTTTIQISLFVLYTRQAFKRLDSQVTNYTHQLIPSIDS